MKIISLKITGFRNLKNIQLDFSGKEEVFGFVGENGQGKTNLLESIYLCALSKSFRSKSNHDLIAFDQDFCRIEMQLEIGSETKKLELIITREPSQKTLKVNGVKKTAMDFIGILKVVFFSPDDLSQMSFAPRLRRRYLDILLSQLDRQYLVNLNEYEKARRQRNAVLKNIRENLAKDEELFFWDEKLAQFGLPILQKRDQVLSEIESKVADIYTSISGKKQSISLNYLSSSIQATDTTSFIKLLKEIRSREIALASTQIGPHRDDIQFLMNGKDMTLFASRGEWRSLVLALKLAELDLIKREIGDTPILLLDDVFSELDEKRQAYLFKNVAGYQTFISTTHESHFEKISSDINLMTVFSGQIKN